MSYFRKYAARNAGIFTVFSVFFPIKGALIFAVRNNIPVDYESYIRRQREEYYRRQQQYYQQYYGGRSRYNEGSATSPRQDDPFEEFSSYNSHSDGENSKDDGNDDNSL